MRRYENWLATVMFVALLVLFALVLDVRGDIASLKRDAAYNAASSRDQGGLRSGPSTHELDARLRCIERRAAGEIMGAGC